MKKRGFNHYSPLDARFVTGKNIQDQFVDSYEEQIIILKNKKCGCKV